MIEVCSVNDDNNMFNSTDITPNFKWWYVDLLDASGNGAVCIFSQGLPFLPTSTVKHEERCAVNVVLYTEGKESFYLLQEYPATESEYTTIHVNDSRHDTWTIGKHVFSRFIDGDSVQCTIEVESTTQLDTPHSIHGQVHVQGALISDIEQLGRNSVHQWIPVTTQCHGTAAFKTLSTSVETRGSAYHDSNISLQPLQRLGISKWWWARVSMETHTWVVYFVDDVQSSQPSVLLVASIDADGNWSTHPVESVDVHRRARSVYGLSMPTRWSISLASGTVLKLKRHSWLDDSPFYQRVVVELTTNDVSSLGFMEHVVPTKLGIPWQQPFIRMKTHYQNTPGSFFSPLFTGPSDNRWSRQLSKCLPF